MADDWREFELLVARIERAVGPAGAVVTSPDFVVDSATGERREVDATIRPRVGEVPIRVIECRDRARVEDVTWIEQLVTKSRDHGIATTAVSSAGFSQSAITKAKHHGIEIRTISEVTQAEMKEWARINEIVNIIYFPAIATVKTKMYSDGGTNETNVGLLHPSVIEQVKAGGGDAPVFRRKLDDTGFTAKQILDAAIGSGFALIAGIPDDGTTVRRVATITFPRDTFCMLTTDGARDLAELILGIDFRAEKSSSPLADQGFCYAGSDRPSVYGIEGKLDVLGTALLASIHRQKGSDRITISITSSLSRA